MEENYLGRWGGDEFVVVIFYVNVDIVKVVVYVMCSGVIIFIIVNDN